MLLTCPNPTICPMTVTLTLTFLNVVVKDLESQLQQDSDAAQEEARALEEQLSGEKQRREDAEQELARHKQVGRFVWVHWTQDKHILYLFIKIITHLTIFTSCWEYYVLLSVLPKTQEPASSNIIDWCYK